MRKSKKIRQLEKANEQLNRTIKNMKVEELELQKHARYRLEDYCEGCPNIKPHTEIVCFKNDFGEVISWGIYISCEHAEKCKQLAKHFEEG